MSEECTSLGAVVVFYHFPTMQVSNLDNIDLGMSVPAVAKSFCGGWSNGSAWAAVFDQMHVHWRNRCIGA